MTGASTVIIGNQPAARIGDNAACSGAVDVISAGSSNVIIEGKPAARVGDATVHGGRVLTGEPTVLIGDQPYNTTSLVAPSAGPKEQEAQIVAIELLDGADEQPVSGFAMQCVNLPRADRWVDTIHVRNQDRLSQKLRFRVRFDRSGDHPFKVRLVPFTDNVQYTTAEEARNPNFKYQDQEKHYITDGNGTKTVTDDFFVTSAGKHIYHLEAQDAHGNRVESNAFETHRLLYLQQLRMQGVSAAANISTFEQEFAKHHIRILHLTPIEMEHMPNISTSDNVTFLNKARAAYLASDGVQKEPYTMAAAFTDHLAVKNPNQDIVSPVVTVGPGAPPVTIHIAARGLTTPAGSAPTSKPLWINIVPGDSWFVSASFLKTGGTPGIDETAVRQSQCIPVASNPAIPDKCFQVSVDVSTLSPGTGVITLRVNLVDRMRAGLAFDNNIICVCTRAYWVANTDVQQNAVMVHELGHKIGMVADGTGRSPDRVSTYYVAKGHVGAHCHFGLPVQTNYGTSFGQCVMFGSMSSSGLVHEFCSNCSPAVLKEDLSVGWSRF